MFGKSIRMLTKLQCHYTGLNWVNNIGNIYINKCSKAATTFFNHTKLYSPMAVFGDYLDHLKLGRLAKDSTLSLFLQNPTPLPPLAATMQTQDPGKLQNTCTTNNKRRRPTTYFFNPQPAAIKALINQLDCKCPQ